ncbi:unnamed protein product [Notodromas monacha]|uniref:Calponin-homology (CH) domain-containing protein n=1 Tax=Notodromas monacha TaxID=399045 RepID=A0A7R9BE22_9CRUS|nr:unnamed protein product [Notodromas monacha]CAG0913676.1 unnamed protein product [Notodromas monacha]
MTGDAHMPFALIGESVSKRLNIEVGCEKLTCDCRRLSQSPPRSCRRKHHCDAGEEGQARAPQECHASSSGDLEAKAMLEEGRTDTSCFKDNAGVIVNNTVELKGHHRASFQEGVRGFVAEDRLKLRAALREPTCVHPFKLAVTQECDTVTATPTTMGVNGYSSSHTSLNKTVEKTLIEAQQTGYLCLSCRSLREFPASVQFDLSDTVTADLSKNRLGTVPDEVCCWSSLQKLDLYCNVIKNIPDSVIALRSLTFLNISRNYLSVLPASLCQLTELQVLLVSHNKLVSLPEEIGHMKSLMELDTSCNQLTHLPPHIGHLRSLKVLNMRRNLIVELPVELSYLVLTQLDVSGNRISVIPPELRLVTSLVTLSISDNPLTSPPAQLCTRGKVHVFKYLEMLAQREEKKKGVIAREAAEPANHPGVLPRRATVPAMLPAHNNRYRHMNGDDRTSPPPPPPPPRNLDVKPFTVENGGSYPSTPSTISPGDPNGTGSLGEEISRELYRMQRMPSSPQRTHSPQKIPPPLPTAPPPVVVKRSNSNVTQKLEVLDANRNPAPGPQSAVPAPGHIQTYRYKGCPTLAWPRARASPVKAVLMDSELPATAVLPGVAQTAYSQPTSSLVTASPTVTTGIATGPTSKTLHPHKKHGLHPPATSSTPKLKNSNPSLRGSNSSLASVASSTSSSMIPKSGAKKIARPGVGVGVGVVGSSHTLGRRTGSGFGSVRSASSLMTNSKTSGSATSAATSGHHHPPGTPKMRVVNSTSTLDRVKRSGLALVPSGTSGSGASLNHPNATMKREWEKVKAEKERLADMKKNIETRLKITLPEDLPKSLVDGVVLCHLANHIRPRAVASIHVPSPAVPKLTLAKCRKNVENFLEACRRIGIPEAEWLEPDDVVTLSTEPWDGPWTLFLLSRILGDLLTVDDDDYEEEEEEDTTFDVGFVSGGDDVDVSEDVSPTTEDFPSHYDVVFKEEEDESRKFLPTVMMSMKTRERAVMALGGWTAWVLIAFMIAVASVVLARVPVDDDVDESHFMTHDENTI